MPDSTSTPFDDLSPQTVLSPAEIAARIGASDRSVRRSIARGELAASRACGIRVMAEDAATWWRSRRITARPPEALAPQSAIPAELDDRVPRRRMTGSPSRLPLPPRAKGAGR